MPVPFVGGHPRRWGILKDSRNAHLLYMAPLGSECCRFFFLRIQIYQLSAHFIVLRLDKAENFADIKTIEPITIDGDNKVSISSTRILTITQILDLVIASTWHEDGIARSLQDFNTLVTCPLLPLIRP